MVVLYGSRNFGYESKESEKTWLEFKYPTWDNIINNEFIGYDRLGADNSTIKVKDIRLIPKMLSKCNFSDLQILYSVERYGCEDIQWIFENRDRLVKYNLWQAFETNSIVVRNKLKLGSDDGLIKAYTYTLLLGKLLSIDGFEMYNQRLNGIRDKLTDTVRKELKSWCIGQLQSLEPLYTECKGMEDTEILTSLHSFIRYTVGSHMVGEKY